MSLRIGIVTPRLEPVTAVGAEVQAAGYASRLAARGHLVEILTTCARDLLTWKNHYAPGCYEADRTAGVPVRRFAVDSRRLRRRRVETEWRIARGETPSQEEQVDWLHGLGRSRDLIDYLDGEGSRYDAFLVTPAVSGITCAIPEAVLARSFLLAALPGGPRGRLPVLRGRYAGAAGVLAGSVPERARIEQHLGIPPERILAAAAPVAEGERDGEAFRRRHGLEVPFLFCVGRRSRDKGTDRLVEYTRLFIRREGVDLRLVLAGENEAVIPPDCRDFVIDLHFIADRDRDDGCAAALACCQPGRDEALALAPMEGWLAGRPVLADAGGDVTASRCRDGGGGITYGDYPEFAEAVTLLLNEPEAALDLGRRGREFVRRMWAWERCLAEVEDACRAVAKSGRSSR
jgi:glycosyltransferase involved in cell wall biosynthesis